MNIIRKRMNILDIALLVSIICCKLHDVTPFELTRTRYYCESTKRTGQTFRPKVRHQISPSQTSLKMGMIERDNGDDDYIDEGSYQLYDLCLHSFNRGSSTVDIL